MVTMGGEGGKLGAWRTTKQEKAGTKQQTVGGVGERKKWKSCCASTKGAERARSNMRGGVGSMWVRCANGFTAGVGRKGRETVAGRRRDLRRCGWEWEGQGLSCAALGGWRLSCLAGRQWAWCANLCAGYSGDVWPDTSDADIRGLRGHGFAQGVQRAVCAGLRCCGCEPDGRASFFVLQPQAGRDEGAFLGWEWAVGVREAAGERDVCMAAPRR